MTVVQQFEEDFQRIKKELKFQANLDDLDKVFFIRDYIAEKGFVSTKLSRMLCGRIVETFMSWYSYLHSLVVPNPNSMVSITESHMINEQRKQEIMRTMDKIMAIASKNSVVGLTKDKKLEAEFIDESLKAWGELLPILQEIMKHIHTGWVERVRSPPRTPRPSTSFG